MANDYCPVLRYAEHIESTVHLEKQISTDSASMDPTYIFDQRVSSFTRVRARETSGLRKGLVNITRCQSPMREKKYGMTACVL